MFKIGDKVKIKSFDEIQGIERTKNVIGPGWDDEMRMYCGARAKIVEAPGAKRTWFRLDVDDGEWVWDASWLKSINRYSSIILPDKMFEI